MASPDPGRAPAKGEEAAASRWPLRKLQEEIFIPPKDASSLLFWSLFLLHVESFAPGLWSQYKAYEDAVVEGTKGTIVDAMVLAREHQTEAIGCATVAGLILFRGPRRFLYRKTLGRFKTEKDLLNDAEQSMMEYKKSFESLKKDSKYTLDKIAIGESDLQRGRTDLRSTGKQIQGLIGSIYKAESTAAGLMDRLRTIPTRQSLELRAEVASMASDLKNQRYVLEERINKISEYGIRV